MGATGKPTESQLSEVWTMNRSYLVDLAFAMLRDIGAAEDAVQEAFARLAVTDFDSIEDKRGWLIVVTSRICINQINSARSRREQTHETSTIESIGVSVPQALPVDPADRVTLDDEVRLALLVVLQQLKPAERVVFVLHDIFRLPFDTIAETMGRSPASCRQLARRARMRVTAKSDYAGIEVDTVEERLVTERFIQACSNGDVSGLLELLEPGASGGVDLGPGDQRTGQVVHGSRRVARNLLRYFGSWTTLVSNPLGGHSIVLAFVEQRLYAVILLSLRSDLIQEIHVIADPEKLAFLSKQLSPAITGDAT
jgi:RNA polymerase sigma-70 factor (ECF subfamily)